MEEIRHKNCGIVWEAPEVLSRKNGKYFRKYGSKLIIGDLEEMCLILMNPKEKIFTPNNIGCINYYDGVMIDGQKYNSVGCPACDILLLINEGKYDKNEILYDTAMMTEPELKRRVLRYLDKEKFIKILEDRGDI